MPRHSAIRALTILIVGGLVAGTFLSSAVAFGKAYSTAVSRQELQSLVNSLPPVMAGIYGNPLPGAIDRSVARSPGRAGAPSP